MLDGAAKTKAMAEEAARLGQPAIGLTDHGYLFGAYDFYTNCKNAGRQADHRPGGLRDARDLAL